MLLNGAYVVNRQSELEDQASLRISQLIILPGPSIPLYIGLKLQSSTGSKYLVNRFCNLGIYQLTMIV